MSDVIEGQVESKTVEEPAKTEQDSDVVGNAIRAWQMITNSNSNLEVYATFGIVAGKFGEFCATMKDKAAVAQAEAAIKGKPALVTA